VGVDEAGRRPWSRRDGWALGLLLLLAAAVRAAWASRSLYTVDSVLFSLGTERYDVAALRPHPPGYPVFVALGWLARKLVGDANAAFVLVSVLFSLGAVAALYALVREWGSRRVAVAAALLFSFAPAFLFNGVVALSYTAEAAASVGIALLAWRAMQRPSGARLAALGLAWGIAVGIRQSLFLFLGPLVALPLWDPGLRWPGLMSWLRRAASAGLPALAAALAWFLPMLRLSGGYAVWKRATDLQSAYVVFADSVLQRGGAALREHWDRLLYFLHWDWLVLLLGAAALALLPARKAGRPWPRGAGLVLAAWLVPVTLFYLLVFDGWDRGPIGYVLTLLPALYAAAALAADAALRTWKTPTLPSRRALAAVGLLLVLVPLAGLAQGSRDLVRDEAQAHDAWAASWQGLAAAYPANHTAILAWYSWAHVEWAFPDHLAWTYFPSYKVPGKTDWALFFSMQHHEQEAPFIAKYVAGPGQLEHPIPATITTIVVFDFQLAGENGSDRKLDPALNVTEARLPDGWRILLFHPDAAHPTIESCFTKAARGLA
jgi:hypothetical protein